MALQWLAVSVALVAGLALPAAAGAQVRAPVKPPAAAGPAIVPVAAVPTASDYVIGPEDMLQISVWKNESLSRQLPVRPDGKVSMPLLHDIQAAGLTPMQLRDKIAAALAEFMPNPEVSVTVLEVRSYRVSVLGEVQRPGVLQLRAPTTVLEAIALAGGFRDFASPSKIVIFRKNGNGTEKLRFNYNRAVGAATEENLPLLSGDVVVVP
ncbi:MAG TPA: polysaccharide biosynthesis/export family protein [Methylomirabilota bacterium]|nr:polysaccharide biosynthesis/export family protein [Methylomirabilota bacterium]